MKTLEFTNAPKLLKPYARSVIGKRKGLKSTEDLPKIAAEWRGIEVDLDHLQRYKDRIDCRENGLPLHYPHVLANGIHLSILTEREFPVRLLGCVHVRNHTIRYRQIDPKERLDLSAEIAGCDLTDKGITFDLDTTVSTSGEKVWSERTTFLVRQKTGVEKTEDPVAHLFSWDETAESDVGAFEIPTGTGRAYAAVCKDYNPIHLAPVFAKAFGFKRDIAHGMWSAARALALTGHVDSDLPTRVDIAFKGPLFMTHSALVKTSPASEDLSVRIHDQKALAKNDARPAIQMRISKTTKTDTVDVF